MLKQRLITGIILIFAFVFILFVLSASGFCIATAGIALAALWEWSGLMGLSSTSHKMFYLILMGCGMAAAFFIPIFWVLGAALLWWLVAAFYVVRYRENQTSMHTARFFLMRSLMGALVMVPCWIALNVLRNANQGVAILLFLCILIWTADSAAYFSGKLFGKHKLLPVVSPGKTWEGLAGGMLAVVLIVFAILTIFKVPLSLWPKVMMVSLVTVIFSILGDLFESMIKRQQGVKDSGRLLPGHGGILDRIDSLTAAAPVFTVGMLWLNTTL